VKLTVEGKTSTQPLVLKMDPRIKTPDAELRAQFEMETGAVRGMNESFRTLAQVRSVEEQLKERAGKLGLATPADSITALSKKIAELEGGAETPFFGVPASGRQPETLATLHQHFATLLGIADSADAMPTTQAQSAYREAQKALQELQQKWSALREQDLPKLNEELANAGQPKIDPNQAPTSAPSDSGDGDDEP
jgi:hypothetical protein